MSEDPMSQFAPSPAPAPDGAPTPDPETGLFLDPRELPTFGKLQKRVEQALRSADQVPEVIGDEDAAGDLADALRQIKHLREDKETVRKDEKRPYEQTGKRIDAAFNELLSPLLGREASLKDRLVKWEDAKQAKAAEEQRQREDEAAERQAAEEEKAADQGEPPPPPPPPPSPRVTPSGARGSIGKSSVRKVRKWRVTDIDQLPEGFYERVPNKSRCAEAAKNGEVVAGLEFFDEPVVQSR
jgi:hypothetical protein